MNNIVVIWLFPTSQGSAATVGELGKFTTFWCQIS